MIRHGDVLIEKVDELPTARKLDQEYLSDAITHEDMDAAVFRINMLEAENLRLREALEWYVTEHERAIRHDHAVSLGDIESC